LISFPARRGPAVLAFPPCLDVHLIILCIDFVSIACLLIIKALIVRRRAIAIALRLFSLFSACCCRIIIVLPWFGVARATVVGSVKNDFSGEKKRVFSSKIVNSCLSPGLKALKLMPKTKTVL
jgi:hypothetical protein